MKYESEVIEVMQKLVIARDADVGEILAARGYYKLENLSARNNARKILKYLTTQGKLEEGGDWFRSPGCRSEHREHSRHLNKPLVEVLKEFPDARIIREKEITAVRLVPDALVLLTKGEKGRVMVLEAVNFEFESFLQSKIDCWEHWPGALDYLTGAFGVKVPWFEIVIYPESPIEGVWNFNEFMEDICK